jgi:hypothetical protein
MKTIRVYTRLHADYDSILMIYITMLYITEVYCILSVSICVYRILRFLYKFKVSISVYIILLAFTKQGLVSQATWLCRLTYSTLLSYFFLMKCKCC